MRLTTIRHKEKAKRRRWVYWDQCIYCVHYWACPLSDEPDTVDCPEFQNENSAEFEPEDNDVGDV